MLHTTIGNIGHLFVILSFITSVLSVFAFYQLTREKNFNNLNIGSWNTFANSVFFAHTISVIGIVSSLFIIIYNHYYEYHYAWSHSSNSLPTHYMVSCFWEGQEGSFLLWMFWQSLLGVLLIFTNKQWKAPVLTTISLVEVFLSSMILGVVLFDIKFGSSPFILLRDFMQDAPVFKMNPDFVPADGTGLNPLLQNYWMVIHPPTLFLGFALSAIPFAYAIAGLWLKEYRNWIRPALPWMLITTLILGIGILMGGYWAYETLNFGGYWNWDPVENAVYVPWLIMVAALHTMIVYKKNETALKTSVILTIVSFLLILYSTFLTRSGILGNASVHSFTDLGLSGQLLVYLLAFVFLSLFLLIKNWKEIPTTESEISTYSREFWIFIGVTVLCLASFQIIYTTSIPVYNAILNGLGFDSRLALPTDPIKHFNNWQIWTAVLIGILSGVGQFFFWNKMEKKEFFDAITWPFVGSLLLSSVIIVLAKIQNIPHGLMLTSGLFGLFCNISILIKLAKNNIKLSGGAITHIGIAMMLIGILFSSGYTNTISINNSGLLYSKEFSDEMNAENILLWRNDPRAMDNYKVTYKGQCVEVENMPILVKKEVLFPLEEDERKHIAKINLDYNGKIYHKKGDTVYVTPENTYYAVEYLDTLSNEKFMLYPRAQVNKEMGLLASPDTRRFLSKDLYTHVSSIPDPTQDKKWTDMEEYEMKLSDTIIVNDYVAILDGIAKAEDVIGIDLAPDDIAVKAIFKVFGNNNTYTLLPVYVIKDMMVGRVSEVVEDLGLKVTLLNINPEKGIFNIGINTCQKDYIIMKAVEKPMINLLWIGTLIMVIGMFIAFLRRYSDFVKMRDKGLE
jgi:cytochrome c-type biogenesis protein CcmF